MLVLTRRRLFHMTGGLALATAIPAHAETLTDDWSGDVPILRRAWETMHPGLYRYSTPSQISERLAGLAAAWSAPGSFQDRFLALTRVTASIRCGHTYPSPSNSTAAIRSRLYPGRTLVPFRFLWIQGRMVVTHDDSGERCFPRGSEVIAVQGVATSELLARLIPLARADGGADGKRIHLMQVVGTERYEAFDIHLPLVLPGLADEAAFTLSDGRVVTAGLLTLAERQSNAPNAVQPEGEANPWTLDIAADGIARLTKPTWALYNSDFDWAAWLGDALDGLTGARGLIVDLRGNEGGEDCGDVILSRLVDRDLPLSRSRRFVSYRRAPDDLHPFLDTWDPSFLDWRDDATPSDERPGFYRMTRFDDGDESRVIRPQGRRFAGPVVVLCDSSNSSATFQFAQAVKQGGVATLIGTPTGGNLRGINGGAFFFLRLPASGLEVDLPLVATFPDTPQPDASIQPDVLVPTTAADVAAGADPQMATAAACILNA